MFKPHSNFRHFLTVLAIVFFLANFSLFFTKPVWAAPGINRTINFQGKLVNAAGTNVTNSTYSVTFSFYNHPTAGSPASGYLWQETDSVTTVDGIFRVALGSNVAFPANFNFNWDGLYLGVKVGSDSEMTPRIQMAAVPFAFNAQQVAGLTVQDTSGNASTSGTLQVANGVTVKLPNSGTGLIYADTGSTGTLANLTNSTSQTGGVVGLALNLSGANGSFNQVGLQLNLSGTTSGYSYDIEGTGNSWHITKGGALTVMSCSGCGGANYWNLVSGVGGGYITPINSTADFLIGSQATSSAAFAVLNLAGGTPVATVGGNLVVMPYTSGTNELGGNASISGNLTFSIYGTGAIQTTNNQLLTIGGNTSGNITLAPLNSAAGSVINLNASNINSSLATVTELATPTSITYGGATTTLTMGGASGTITLNGTTIATNQTSGSLAVFNTGLTGTLNLAGAATVVNIGAPTGSASISATLVLGGTNSSTIEPGNGTLNFGYKSGLNTWATAMTIRDNTGYIGIGTTAPFVTLDVRGSSGTLAVASISGTTSFATLVANNNGVGDLFTASASGWPRFTISNAGNVNASGAYQIGGTSVLSTTTLGSGVTGSSLTSVGTLGGLTVLGATSINTSGSNTTNIGTGSNAGTITIGNASSGDLALNDAQWSVTGLGAGTFASLSNGGNLAFTGSSPSITNTGGNTLTLNSGSTGNLQFFGATNYIDSSGNLTLAGTTGITLSGNGADLNFSGTSGLNTITTASNQNFAINPGGTGLFGINTDGTTPLANFDVRPNVGTIAIASISGATSFASLVANNDGVGDLFTASASGWTKFVIQNNGNVGIGTNTPTAKLAIEGVVGGDVASYVQANKIKNVANDSQFSGTGHWTTSGGQPPWNVNVNSSGVAAKDAPGTGVFTLTNNTTDFDTLIAAGTYELTYTFTTTGTSSGSLTPGVGGTNGTAVGQDVNMSKTDTQLITSFGAGDLTFTPTMNWYGTIDNVILRQVNTVSPIATILNSNGTTAIDFRNGGSGKSNTFIGLNAGQSNTTGGSNSFIGYQAGQSNTTGSLNSFFGNGAGEYNTTGSNNSFLGMNAGSVNTSGSYNSFLGAYAGNSNTTGYNNSFVGDSAGGANTAGNNNSFVGFYAGLSNLTGYQNSFLGSYAGQNNTTGYQNSFFGETAGLSNLTGYDNSFLGYMAGWLNTSGYNNSFLGFYAGYNNNAGYNNSFLGGRAGFSNTAGFQNSFLGYQAGQSTTLGTNNTAVGDQAGQTIDVGGLNTLLGYGADVGLGNLINATAIGANAYVTQNNSLILGSILGVNNATASAMIGIGTTAPLATLDVRGSSGTLGVASFSGNSSFAGLTINQLGTGDIFTASASGVPLFTVQQNGNLVMAGNGSGISFTGTGIDTISTATNQNFAINPGGSGLVGINTDGTTPLANFDVRLNNGTIAIASISGATSFAGLVVDNSGTGALIAASASGATRFVVNQNGSVGIGGSLANSGYNLDVVGSARIAGNSTNDDITKNTTSDFTQGTFCSGSGYCSTNVSIANNDISMQVDNSLTASTINPTSTGAPSTVIPISSGSAIMRQQNGVVAFLGGVSAASARIYTYSVPTNTFTVGPNLTATIGSGSAVFQRQDGKFVITYANRSDIYDPAGSNNFGSIAVGPNLPVIGGVQYIAGGGSRVIPHSDGKFLVLLGGSQYSALYDPVANTMAQGPALSGAGNIVASGSAVFQRQDGKWIVILGGNTTTTNIYDPVTSTFSAGPTLQSAAGTGANVLQLPDGRFMVIDANNNINTDIYNFATNTFTAGPQFSDKVGTGSTAFQMANNKWIITVGNGSKATYLYDPTSGTTGSLTQVTNNLPNSVGVGGGVFQRDNGSYLILNGALGTNSTVYDVGWRTGGVWTSEDITSTKISTYSAIFWDSTPAVSASPSAGVEVYVKTAVNGNLGSVSYNLIQNNGDLIQTMPGATQVKVQIQFNSPIAPPYNQVVGTAVPSNMWASEGSTEYVRQITQPTLYDFKIQNPIAGYGGVLASDSTEDRNAATQSAVFNGTVTGDSDSVTLATFENGSVPSSNADIIVASASADLGGTAGTGSHTLQLPNGKFLIILAGNSNATRMYDSTTGLFTVGPTTVGASNPNTGSFSIPLPNGQFMLFIGASQLTDIYDPVRNIFFAGPSVTAAIGAGAHAILRSDGRFLIILGGATANTNIYDPFLNSFTAGPATTSTVTAGAYSIKRPDGKYLVFLGTSAVTDIYEESSNSFVVGPATTAAYGANATTVQISNGNWLQTRGTAATTIYLYDARLGTFTAALGEVLSANAGAGAFTIPLPDGKILWANGGATSTTIVDPSVQVVGGTWAGPTLPSPSNLAAGTNVFQRPDGKFVVIVGGSSNTMIIDAGWNLQGTYVTEPINSNNLTANTSLDWKNVGQGAIGVQSRTGSSLAAMTATNWNDVEKAGGLINPNAGDTWAQFKFTLTGTMPNMPYEKERVWSGIDSGGSVDYYRQIQTPTLQYWRLANTTDPNILTLTSEGMNAFRFAADGQAYTAAGGAWNSGGADLAENYTSTQTLNPGEVVVGDQFNAQNVIQSTMQYQSNIMGVVSTDPGFVAGAYTPDSYPIALVGRVPVLVSTENGPIHSGDYLTSSSIPGYAMKATVAGRVLGTAIEDFDPTDPTEVSDCPAQGAGSLSTTQCGTITVFVNLTSYNGESVELAMADENFVASTSAGFADIYGDTGLDSYMNQISSGDQNTLVYLQSLKDAGSAAFNSSEVFTGTVAAGEVISPEIVADLITAKTIRADHIEGLEILTNQISALSNSVAVLSDATQSGELATATPSATTTLPSTLNLSDLNVNGLATISADLNVAGNGLIQGALNVLDSLTTNNFLVSGFSYFMNDVVFKGNVRFNSTPTFNSDTAGFAVIKQGEDTVSVTFDNEYADTPVVTASIALDKINDQVAQKALEDAILNGNLSYVITDRTTQGFTIRLNKPAPEDINFSWVALSVQDAKTAGLEPVVPTPEPQATQSAAFQSILNQVESSTPTITPTQ